ncbi:MAG: hypothetical protein ACJ75J_10120 [Cytophagaceae bacterium]
MSAVRFVIAFGMLFFISGRVYSQNTLLTDLVGDWSCIDKYGREQKLIFTKDSLIHKENWPTFEDGSKSNPVNYKGKIVIEGKKKLKIIYHPKEQVVRKIVKVDNSCLIIKSKRPGSLFYGNKLRYKKST